jgi:hypothetical protein
VTATDLDLAAMTTWRAYVRTPPRPSPKHREPADRTARDMAREAALRAEDREEIKRAAKAAAVAVMERWERTRG